MPLASVFVGFLDKCCVIPVREVHTDLRTDPLSTSRFRLSYGEIRETRRCVIQTV